MCPRDLSLSVCFLCFNPSISDIYSLFGRTYSHALPKKNKPNKTLFIHLPFVLSLYYSKKQTQTTPRQRIHYLFIFVHSKRCLFSHSFSFFGYYVSFLFSLESRAFRSQQSQECLTFSHTFQILLINLSLYFRLLLFFKKIIFNIFFIFLGIIFTF